MLENPTIKKRIVEPEGPSREPSPVARTTTTSPSPAELCGVFSMVPKHTSLVDMHNEWCGLGGKHENDFGGINGRNMAYGKKWRGHLPNQQYSRTARIIAVIGKRVADTNTSIPSCISEMDVLFKENKGVLSKYVEELQLQGLIPKKASRGKTKK